MCDLRKISEIVWEKSERKIQKDDDTERTDKRKFLSWRKPSEIFPSCPVEDRHFNVCFIAFNTYFGLEKKICLFHRATGSLRIPYVLHMHIIVILKQL